MITRLWTSEDGQAHFEDLNVPAGETETIALQAGADMTATDKDGHTPLQVAEYEKHEDVKQLLEKAQIALLNLLKQTPTDEKRTAYTEQATERLSQNPIPGKATTQDGDTPLHLVNKEGPTAIPQLHIANGG